MLATVVIQIGIPVILLVLLARSGAGNTQVFVTQCLATGFVLVALALVSLWMLLPWWLPYLYGLLWLGITANLLWKRRTERCLTRTASAFDVLRITVAGVVGAWAALLAWHALQGRQMPSTGVVDIQWPLTNGRYLVAQGGSHVSINGHMVTLNPDIERYRAYRGQSFGIDLIKIDAFGLRSSGIRPSDPAQYGIYGDPVYAPCNGVVLDSRNDRPDMPVPVMDLEFIPGNHVLLQCQEFVVLLAHFQPATVRVRPGDLVQTGDWIARVGNSGKTTEPHLHVSAQRTGTGAAPLSGAPLALTIEGKFYVRNDRIHKRKAR